MQPECIRFNHGAHSHERAAPCDRIIPHCAIRFTLFIYTRCLRSRSKGEAKTNLKWRNSEQEPEDAVLPHRSSAVNTMIRQLFDISVAIYSQVIRHSRWHPNNYKSCPTKSANVGMLANDSSNVCTHPLPVRLVGVSACFILYMEKTKAKVGII